MEDELQRIHVSYYPLPFLTLDDDGTYSEEESLRGESSDLDTTDSEEWDFDKHTYWKMFPTMVGRVG